MILQSDLDVGRVFASSDWHGCGKVANKVLEFLELEDTLFFLGDAIDRGPDGAAILDALFHRPNTFFLKGNHEEFFEISPIQKPDLLWLGANGGSSTYLELSKDEEKYYRYQQIIKGLPTELIYESSCGHKVILEHAGYSPFNICTKTHDPLWDRSHFKEFWIPFYKEETSESGNTYLVHGHTPVQYLKYEYGYIDQPSLTSKDFENKRCWFENGICDKPEVIRYCDGHKFDIDMCTVLSKRIALLNLNTFETLYFDEEDD